MRVPDIFTRVTFRDFCAQLFEVSGDLGLLLIRAGDTETQVGQHLGNSGHADAADADEVNMLKASKHKNQLAEGSKQ